MHPQHPCSPEAAAQCPVVLPDTGQCSCPCSHPGCFFLCICFPCLYFVSRWMLKETESGWWLFLVTLSQLYWMSQHPTRVVPCHHRKQRRSSSWAALGCWHPQMLLVLPHFLLSGSEKLVGFMSNPKRVFHPLSPLSSINSSQRTLAMLIVLCITFLGIWGLINPC